MNAPSLDLVELSIERMSEGSWLIPLDFFIMMEQERP